MSLDLYIGSMFSGKSSAVIAAIRRNAVVGIKTMCITHKADTRYKKNAIVSHNGESYPATAVSELLPLLISNEFRSCSHVIIEEANFFQDLKQFVVCSVDILKKHVICVGLDGDFERKPFGQLLDLIPYADDVKKFKALCSICRNGTEACFTDRICANVTEQLVVGGTDEYQALCREHFLQKMNIHLCGDDEKMKAYLTQYVLPVCSQPMEFLNKILEHVPIHKCDIFVKDAYPMSD